MICFSFLRHDKKIVTNVTDGLNAYLQIAQSVEIQSLQIDVVINPITVINFFCEYCILVLFIYDLNYLLLFVVKVTHSIKMSNTIQQKKIISYFSVIYTFCSICNQLTVNQ